MFNLIQSCYIFFFKIIKEYKIIFLIVNEEEQSKGKNILKKFKKNY